MPEFRDRLLAKQYVKSFLPASLGDDAFAETVAEACLAKYQKVTIPSPPPGVMALMIRRISWVIRDEDLKASDTFWKALAAAGGANFFRSSVTASAVVGLVSAAFSAFHAVRSFGVRLTIEQTQVLVALKKLETPSTPEEIASALDTSLEKVNDNLSSLKTARRADGSVIAVVASDNEGRWACAGI